MYRVVPSKQYRKSLKKILAGGKVKILEIDQVIDMLCRLDSLPGKYRDHALAGDYIGYRECHIRPNVLLIYKKERNILFLMLRNIGSHPELFG